MGKKSPFFLVVLFLLCVWTVGAVDSDFFYKQGEVVDLKIPCVNNGTQCSNATLCNITINYPNGSVLVNNKRMKYSGTFHNYTLQDSNNAGQYSSTVFCSDISKNGYSNFFFTINNIGMVDNTDILGVIIFFIGIIILFIILTIISFVYDYEIMATLFLSLTFLFLTTSLFVVWQYSQQVTFKFAGVVYTVYFSSLILTITIILMSVVNFIIHSWDQYKIGKQEKKDRIPY